MIGPAMFRLDGKVAIVTGATSGIGLAIAEGFAAAGAHVVVSSENAGACGEVSARLAAGASGKVIGVRADAGVAEDLAMLCDTAEAQLGPVDILVSNAGIEGHVGPIGEASETTWDRLFDINLRAAWRLSARLAPKMAERGGGSLIFTASLSALRGNKAIGLYGLSKAALAQLARNLAVEWGPKNVRANAIAPGLIRTPLAAAMLADAARSERRLGLTPLRRAGEPAEIAGTALWLASPAGAFVTGQTIVVDGGTLITDGN